MSDRLKVLADHPLNTWDNIGWWSCKMGTRLDPFMRYRVTRFDWFGLRKKRYAVICQVCKEIIAWEAKP